MGSDGIRENGQEPSVRHHGLKIKNLVHQINGLLRPGGNRKEEKLRFLSKDRGEILARRETPYPAGVQEIHNFAIRRANPLGPGMGRAASGNHRQIGRKE